MKLILSSTILAAVIFLIIDVIWLCFATKSFYRPLLGDLIIGPSDKPVLWAAALFYILYVIGMALVVIQPCINSESILTNSSPSKVSFSIKISTNLSIASLFLLIIE